LICLSVAALNSICSGHFFTSSQNAIFDIQLFVLETNSLKGRITVNPDQCGGRPCIRGMRIRVIDILELLATGLNKEQILEELPDLEREDIEAALRYVSSKFDHPVIAA